MVIYFNHFYIDFADLTSIKRETESNVQASLKNCLIEKPNNDAAGMCIKFIFITH